MEYHRQVLQSKLDEGKYVVQSSFSISDFFELKGNWLTVTAKQGQANIHLSIRYHHVAVHCEAERLPK
jgi:hypothetical protein